LVIQAEAASRLGLIPLQSRRLEASVLNRCAIVLRPKRPFLSWIDTVQRTMPKEYRIDVDDDQTVYLIPSSESWNAIDEVLASMYPEMFEHELSEWYDDPALWPQPRTLKMFKEWFKVEVSTMIVDLVAAPLIDDEAFECDSLWSKIKRLLGFGR
jgi:hypothetical protein